MTFLARSVLTDERRYSNLITSSISFQNLLHLSFSDGALVSHAVVFVSSRNARPHRCVTRQKRLLGRLTVDPPTYPGSRGPFSKFEIENESELSGIRQERKITSGTQGTSHAVFLRVLSRVPSL